MLLGSGNSLRGELLISRLERNELPCMFGLGPQVWRVLARCHDVRNRGEYEGDLHVDERLLADLIQACARGWRSPSPLRFFGIPLRVSQ
jgi:hypothetical protein